MAGDRDTQRNRDLRHLELELADDLLDRAV